MPITDISSVTSTIINLIELVVGPLESGDDPDTSSTESTLEVTAAPPDDTTTANPRRVSVHLLHIVETPEFRNYGGGGQRSNIPVQQLPMGLVLQYAISLAPVDTTDQDAPYHALAAQRIIGRIARAFHDYPIITKKTKVPTGSGEAEVLVGDLGDSGDTIELILRPAPLEETFNYWATQNQRLPRVCLFVEARVAVLQPKPPTILPGVVLSVGSFVYPNAGPQLLNSHSTVTFVPPLPPGNTEPFTAKSSPARAALIPDGTFPQEHPLYPNSLVTLDANGLSPGKRFLVLREGERRLKIALDDVDTSNAGWSFSVTSTKVSFHFRNEVTVVSAQPPLEDPGDPAALIPAIYGARIVVEDDRLGIPPRPRTSNEIAIAIGPQIMSITGPSSGAYTLTIAGNYLTAYPPESPTVPPTQDRPEIQLVVGGTNLTRVDDLATLEAGEFRRSGESTIDFALPVGMAGPTSLQPLPVQLLVNGVAAPPEWVKAP